VKAQILAKKTVKQAMQDVKLPNFAGWKGYDWLDENVRLVFQELTRTGSTDAGSGAATMASPKGVEGPDLYRGL